MYHPPYSCQPDAKRKTYSRLQSIHLDFENMVKKLVFIFLEQDLILEQCFFLKAKLLRFCFKIVQARRGQEKDYITQEARTSFRTWLTLRILQRIWHQIVG